MSLAMSAFAFNNCAYPDWEPESSPGTGDGDNTSGLVIPAVTDFSVIAQIAQTKSALSSNGEIVWSDGDLINVFHNVAGESGLVSDGIVYYDAYENPGNEFRGKLGESLKNGYTYDWYLFYPYTEGLTIVDNAAPVTIGSKTTLPQVQAGYGNVSHLTGKYMPMYGMATGVEEGKTPIAELSQLTSVVELNIASCMPQPIEITEVKLTAGEEIIGSFVIDFLEGTITPVEGASSKTATLVISDATPIEEGQTETFYLIVKPFVASAQDGLAISVNGSQKQITLSEDLAFAPGQVTSIDYTFYDVTKIQDSLLGKFKIKTMWVYGGTGAEYGGAGWVPLHNDGVDPDKASLFDQTTGHGVAAELDNYLEFTLIDLIDAGAKLTGKCVNYAGVDGMFWSCYFYNSSINGGVPDDGNKFYRQIPIGESTWVRDLTVEPNTVTFTDSYGNVTVVEIYEPTVEFVPGYNDSNAKANTKTFPLSDENALTFHKKLTNGVDNWKEGIIYNEIDKVYYRPRDFFIDVERVDEIPAEAQTYEPPYVPDNPYPESIAGTYKYNSDVTYGGKDGAITGKGLITQYGGWSGELDGVKFMDLINKIKNDVYIFTATGTDAKQNEVGTVTMDLGEDGTWNYQLWDNKVSPYKPYDATELYGFIAPDGSTTYVWDRTAKTITFTTRGKEYVVNYLLPGTHNYHGLTTAEATVKVPETGFGMFYDMGYTETRVEGYTDATTGFGRHYVWAREWVLCLKKQ
jgi:hypothetical protein